MRLLDDDGYPFNAAGNIIVPSEQILNQTLILHGSWEDRGKYGMQFKIQYAEEPMPENKKATRKFLIKEVKGIGKVTADAIVNKQIRNGYLYTPLSLSKTQTVP